MIVNVETVYVRRAASIYQSVGRSLHVSLLHLYLISHRKYVGVWSVLKKKRTICLEFRCKW